MKKFKLFSTIFSFIFLTTIFAMPAFAEDYISAWDTLKVREGGVYELGTVEMELSSDRLQKGSSAVFSLPSDFEFRNSDGSIMKDSDWEFTVNDRDVRIGNEYNYFKFRENSSAGNALYNREIAPFIVEQINANEIKVTVNIKIDETKSISNFTLHLGKIYIADGYTGDIRLDIVNDGSSGFIDTDEDIGHTKNATKNNINQQKDNIKKFFHINGLIALTVNLHEMLLYHSTVKG